MAFSDELIRAVGQDRAVQRPEGARQHLADVLIKRRDKIGRAYLTRLNPVVDPGARRVWHAYRSPTRRSTIGWPSRRRRTRRRGRPSTTRRDSPGQSARQPACARPSRRRQDCRTRRARTSGGDQRRPRELRELEAAGAGSISGASPRDGNWSVSSGCLATERTGRLMTHPPESSSRAAFAGQAGVARSRWLSVALLALLATPAVGAGHGAEGLHLQPGRRGLSRGWRVTIDWLGGVRPDARRSGMSRPASTGCSWV